MDKYGSNLFYIYENYDDNVSGVQLFPEDVTLIKQSVPEVKYLAPMTYSRMMLQGDSGRTSVDINATTSDFAFIRKIKLSAGRFISKSDDMAARRVVVLHEETARKLFGQENPVGRRVLLNNNSALVIGVVKAESSALGFGSRPVCYIPWSTYKSTNPQIVIHDLWGGAGSKEQVATALTRSKMVLERRHNLPNHYKGGSMEEEMQSANKVTGIMTLIISCIAGISLLVGGIGVMNIMLVSVTERTQEIGIRMALGAGRKNILVQFLIESIVLCLLGGIIGTVLGYGGAYLVAHFAKWPPLVSWSTVLVAFLFSAAVGLFFGIYPANRASKLDPIEALRRD